MIMKWIAKKNWQRKPPLECVNIVDTRVHKTLKLRKCSDEAVLESLIVEKKEFN